MLEHTPEDGLETFLLNVKRHSEDGVVLLAVFLRALVCVSRSLQFMTRLVGGQVHRAWFRMLPGADMSFKYIEFCRPSLEEVDLRGHPNLGFHFVA